MEGKETLIPRHGGYRNLKSFQVAQLVYDLTVRFCDIYVEKFSRTRDQMTQAARSGVQNIAEGSQASAASKKMELKLTSVARASLEELRLDYEDFLRQNQFSPLPANHPALARFKRKRCKTLKDVQRWVAQERRLGLEAWREREGTGPERNRGAEMDEHGPARTDTDRGCTGAGSGGGVRREGRGAEMDEHGPARTDTDWKGPLPSSVLAANAALSLLNLACYLLDRQIAAQARSFEEEGGFTERLYRVRTAYRKKKEPWRR